MPRDTHDPAAGPPSPGRQVSAHPVTLRATAFTQAPIGMAVIDERYHLRVANPIFSELLGRPLSEMRGRSIVEVLPIIGVLENEDLEETSPWRVIALEGPGRREQEVMFAFHRIEETEKGHLGLVTLLGLDHVLAAMPGQDAFTGTACAWLFQDRLIHAMARAERLEQGLAVLLVELDDHEALVQRLGEEITGSVLRQVSRRIGRTFRGEDSVARLGRSQWAVLLEHPVCPQSLHTAAQRLEEEMDAPFDVPGRPLLLTTSIGIARYPEEGEDVDELMSAAEMALERARKRGPGQHDFLERRLRRRLEDEEVLRQELQEALLSPGEHFAILYQPEVGPGEGVCRRLEALVRWEHPSRGLLSPHEFLPAAAAMGQLIRLDRWVLERVIRQHGEWRESGNILATMDVSVNLDAAMLEQRVFDGRPLDHFLRHQGEALEWLSLEIEVSGLVDKGHDQLHLLKRLGQLGIGLVADDLGRLPIDVVQLAALPFRSAKIGRALTAAMDTQPHVALSLAALRQCLAVLGVPVTLVGIETEDQRQAALSMGFEAMQGNVFSPPLAGTGLHDWITALVARE